MTKLTLFLALSYILMINFPQIQQMIIESEKFSRDEGEYAFRRKSLNRIYNQITHKKSVMKNERIYKQDLVNLYNILNMDC